MKLPRESRARFQRQGKTGGHIRAQRLSPAGRSAIARRAAVSRWTLARFGKRRFAALGFPGGEMIDAGLDELAYGEETMESLMVSLAAGRLRREGVSVPAATAVVDPDMRLYRLLERTSGDLAHARYHACLRQVASFADACRFIRLDPHQHA